MDELAYGPQQFRDIPNYLVDLNLDLNSKSDILVTMELLTLIAGTGNSIFFERIVYPGKHLKDSLYGTVDFRFNGYQTVYKIQLSTVAERVRRYIKESKASKDQLFGDISFASGAKKQEDVPAITISTVEKLLDEAAYKKLTHDSDSVFELEYSENIQHYIDNASSFKMDTTPIRWFEDRDIVERFKQTSGEEWIRYFENLCRVEYLDLFDSLFELIKKTYSNNKTTDKDYYITYRRLLLISLTKRFGLRIKSSPADLDYEEEQELKAKCAFIFNIIESMIEDRQTAINITVALRKCVQKKLYLEEMTTKQHSISSLNAMLNTFYFDTNLDPKAHDEDLSKLADFMNNGWKRVSDFRKLGPKDRVIIFYRSEEDGQPGDHNIIFRYSLLEDVKILEFPDGQRNAIITFAKNGLLNWFKQQEFKLSQEQLERAIILINAKES